MAWIAAIIAVAGMGVGAAGARKQAKAAKKQGQQDRALAEKQAKRVIATGQRTAFEQEREAKLLQSRALAISAASGAGASDPSATNVLAGIEAEGSYRAAVALYESEEEAAYLRAGGSAAEYAGRERSKAIQIGSYANLAGEAATLYTRYGGKGPKDSTPSGTSGGDYG